MFINDESIYGVKAAVLRHELIGRQPETKPSNPILDHYPPNRGRAKEHLGRRIRDWRLCAGCQPGISRDEPKNRHCVQEETVGSPGAQR